MFVQSTVGLQRVYPCVQYLHENMTNSSEKTCLVTLKLSLKGLGGSSRTFENIESSEVCLKFLAHRCLFLGVSVT